MLRPSQVSLGRSDTGMVPEESHDKVLEKAWDDVTGEELNADKVRQAREEEMQMYRDRMVYVTVPREQAIAEGAVGRCE